MLEVLKNSSSRLAKKTGYHNPSAHSSVSRETSGELRALRLTPPPTSVVTGEGDKKVSLKI